jgi:hypothetical protein
MIIRVVFIAFCVFMILNNFNFCNYELTEKKISGPVKLFDKRNQYTLQFFINNIYEIDKNNNTNYCMNSNDIKNEYIYTLDYSMALAYNPEKNKKILENNSLLNIVINISLIITTLFSFIFY